MTWSALATFALALALAAGSPGPSIAALVARVLTRGVLDVLPFLAAMWIGEAIWLTATVAGLAYIAAAFATLFTLIKFAGVGYLLYLAWQLWHAPPAEGGADAALPAAREPLRMFLAGLAVTLGNPKIMVFYMALVPSIIDLARVDLSAWAALTLTMIVVLVLVDGAWTLAAARARRFLRSARAVRIANRTSAALMTGAAAAIAART